MKKTLIYLIICCLVPLSTIAETEDTIAAEVVEDEAEDSVITLDPVPVVGERIERKSRQTLDGELLKKTPGSAGDPLRGIARLPSVATINDFLGVLSVRGGAPEDNLYYFDRLPLGYPYHLLGIVSVVSSEVIGQVDVYPGGFGAEFGADAQAVIDIHSVPKNKESLGRFDGTIKPSFIYTEAFFNGAFDLSNQSENLKDPESDKFNETPVWNDSDYLDKALVGQGYWYAFGRLSYLEPLFELASRLVEVEDLVRQVPRFWSYQLKGVYKLNSNHGLVLNAVTAYDAFKLQLGSQEVHDSDLQGPLNSANPFDIQGIHFYSQLLPQFRSILSLTRSFSENEIAFGEDYYYRTASSIYALRNDFIYTMPSEKNNVEFGYLLSSEPSTIISHGARRPEEGDPNYGFRIRQNLKTVNVTKTQNLHNLEGYLQSQYNFFSSEHLGLFGTFGMRASYFNLTDSLSLQPRGQLRLDLPAETTLYFSYGRYAQSPRLDQTVLGVTPNPDLEPSRATHYILELKQSLPFGAKINLAGYYKTLQDLIRYNEDEKQYQNGQTGFVRGFEASLEYQLSKAFNGWVAYAYTISKRRDFSEKFHRFYTYNSPHVLTIAASYSAPTESLVSIPLIKTLDINAKWQYQSGVLYAPLTGRAIFTNFRTKEMKWQPVYGEWTRTIPYHRLDLSLYFQLFGGLKEQDWKLGFALEAWNVYNRNNILEVRYSPNFTKEEPISQLPIIPFVAMVLEF